MGKFAGEVVPDCGKVRVPRYDFCWRVSAWVARAVRERVILVLFTVWVCCFILCVRCMGKFVIIRGCREEGLVFVKIDGVIQVFCSISLVRDKFVDWWRDQTSATTRRPSKGSCDGVRSSPLHRCIIHYDLL